MPEQEPEQDFARLLREAVEAQDAWERAQAIADALIPSMQEAYHEAYWKGIEVEGYSAFRKRFDQALEIARTARDSEVGDGE